MSEDLRELVDEMKEMREEQRQTRDAVIDLRAGLRQRCPNNERRIEQLEKRPRNGGNGSGAGISFKALLAALAVITVLAGALATVATHALGVP